MRRLCCVDGPYADTIVDVEEGESEVIVQGGSPGNIPVAYVVSSDEEGAAVLHFGGRRSMWLPASPIDPAD